MRVKKARDAIAAIVVLLAATSGLTACSSSGAQGANGTQTFKIGVKPADATSSFLLMAESKKFYEKFGCNVELVTLKDSSATMNALISGEVDGVEESPSQFFIASEKGNLKAKIIGSWMSHLPYAIYAKADITSLKDIEGRTLAISSPVGLPAIVAKEILKRQGVDLSKIEYVNAGGNADRYRAVVAGSADAAASPADYVPNAEKDGVKVLGLSGDFLPEYPRSSTIVLEKSLQEKPECAKAYMAGTIHGARYAYAHPDEAKQIAAEAMKVEADDPSITYMYDEISTKKLVSPDAEMPTESLKYLSDLMVEMGELKQPADFGALVDDSYRQEAIKMVDKEAKP
jgi:NitT/TauT family transport system substrate-binding protein